MSSWESYVRKVVPYVPGEQPQEQQDEKPPTRRIQGGNRIEKRVRFISQAPQGERPVKKTDGKGTEKADVNESCGLWLFTGKSDQTVAVFFQARLQVIPGKRCFDVPGRRRILDLFFQLL